MWWGRRVCWEAWNAVEKLVAWEDEDELTMEKERERQEILSWQLAEHT